MPSKPPLEITVDLVKLKCERFVAMDINSVIESSPEKLGGTPVFKGTRVPVQNLIDYLESGDNLDDFLDDFPTVTRQSAIDVLECAKELLLTPPNEHSS